MKTTLKKRNLSLNRSTISILTSDCYQANCPYDIYIRLDNGDTYSMLGTLYPKDNQPPLHYHQEPEDRGVVDIKELQFDDLQTYIPQLCKTIKNKIAQAKLGKTLCPEWCYYFQECYDTGIAPLFIYEYNNDTDMINKAQTKKHITQALEYLDSVIPKLNKKQSELVKLLELVKNELYKI